MHCKEGRKRIFLNSIEKFLWSTLKALYPEGQVLGVRIADKYFRLLPYLYFLILLTFDYLKLLS